MGNIKPKKETIDIDSKIKEAELILQSIIYREYETYQPTKEEWKLIKDDARKYLNGLKEFLNERMENYI